MGVIACKLIGTIGPSDQLLGRSFCGELGNLGNIRAAADVGERARHSNSLAFERGRGVEEE